MFWAFFPETHRCIQRIEQNVALLPEFKANILKNLFGLQRIAGGDGGIEEGGGEGVGDEGGEEEV
jgi:hypothetical protein